MMRLFSQNKTNANRALRWIIFTTVLIAAFVTASIFRDIWIKSGNACKEKNVFEVLSPDNLWRARTIEYLCESAFVTDITDGVHVESVNRPGLDTDILGVDTGGNIQERPRIAWTAPNVLQVTVPNISYLKVLTREFGGVRIDLRYDPDDPAARAAWRRKLGEPPGLDVPK